MCISSYVCLLVELSHIEMEFSAKLVRHLTFLKRIISTRMWLFKNSCCLAEPQQQVTSECMGANHIMSLCHGSQSSTEAEATGLDANLHAMPDGTLEKFSDGNKEEEIES